MYKAGCPVSKAEGFDFYSASPAVYPSTTPSSCTHRREFSSDVNVRNKCSAKTSKLSCLFEETTGKGKAGDHNQEIEGELSCKVECLFGTRSGYECKSMDYTLASPYKCKTSVVNTESVSLTA